MKVPFELAFFTNGYFSNAYLWKCGSYAPEVTIPPNAELLGLPGTHPGVRLELLRLTLNTNLLPAFQKRATLSYLRLLKDTFGFDSPPL